jgi:hypothetical protein
MSTLREAAQQALEALEGFVRFAAIHSDGPDASDKYLAEDYAEEAFLKTAKVLPDLRAALAQQEPEQEPFGYIWPTGRHPEFRYIKQMRDGVAGMPLYAHTPRHEWKGLTDTEIGMLYVTWDATPRVSMADFARAIEQACKERNT